MQVVDVKLSDLKPAAYNPRTISEDEFKGLQASIVAFGFVEPIVVNKDMTIIGGHQRYQVAKKMGLMSIPAHVVDLSKHDERKLNVLLNSPAISGSYDEIKLAELLEELKLDANYYDLRLDQLEPLDLSDAEIEEDEAPELPSGAPISELGAMYQLGKHRLLCGDSTQDLPTLLTGAEPAMVFTDPPYGVDYQSRVDEKRRKGWGKIENDDLKSSELQDFLATVLNQTAEPKYICCNWQSYYDFEQALGKPNALIVWDKGSIGLGAGYRNQHEFILFYGTLDHNSESNVWTINRDSSYAHPTQKPVAIPARAILNSSKRGDIVLDYFLGSGSTLIACEQLDRICYGLELDPKYCDVIRKRYAKLIDPEGEQSWESLTPRIN